MSVESWDFIFCFSILKTLRIQITQGFWKDIVTCFILANPQNCVEHVIFLKIGGKNKCFIFLLKILSNIICFSDFFQISKLIHINCSLFQVYEEELGFSKNEIRHIAHTVPKNLSIGKKKLTQIFDYVHNVMGISHKLMVHFPQVRILKCM